MRFSKELIPILFILTGLIAVSVLYKRNEPPRSLQTPYAEYTSYNPAERGAKALYLLVERLGYRPERIRTSYHTGMPSDGLAVVIAPAKPISETETEELLKWVRRGNTLLFVSGEQNSALINSLKLRLRRRRPQSGSVAPFASTDLTAGVTELALQSGNRIRTTRQDVVRHFRDNAGVVVISCPEGAGTVIVLSDPYLVTNKGLSKGDNLALLVNILLFHAANERTVYFDEYHHGFGRRQTVLDLLKGTSLGWALVQVAAATALLMYSRGRRFGRPEPVLKESHRSSLEYVTSLARIYKTAEATDIALSELRERLLRSARGRTMSGNVRKLMDEFEKMKYKKLSERELLELSRRMALAQHLQGYGGFSPCPKEGG